MKLTPEQLVKVTRAAQQYREKVEAIVSTKKRKRRKRRSKK